MNLRSSMQQVGWGMGYRSKTHTTYYISLTTANGVSHA